MSMANYFSDYANLCFEAFGDRVKHWVTFSDPRVSRPLLQVGKPTFQPRVHPVTSNTSCGSHLPSLQTMAEEGYETGHHAPGLKLQGTGLYKAAHHVIKVRWVLLGVKARVKVERRAPVRASLPQGPESEPSPLPPRAFAPVHHSLPSMSIREGGSHPVLCWTLWPRCQDGSLELAIWSRGWST